MSLIIVTKNQYLVASKIHHITLDENREYIDVRGPAGKLIGAKIDSYSIHITYVPESTNSNMIREETRECTVTLRGKVDAYRVYKDLIRQIREQMPDALFLDKAFESLLSEKDLEDIFSQKQEEELFYDRSTKRIRPPRKAKRRNKKILRKP